MARSAQRHVTVVPAPSIDPMDTVARRMAHLERLGITPLPLRKPREQHVEELTPLDGAISNNTRLKMLKLHMSGAKPAERKK